MSAQSIACRQLVEMVTDYLEGVLSPAQLRAVEDHLTECDDCAQYLSQMQQVIALSRSTFDAKASPGDLPLGMLDVLMETFRGHV
ncbi:hypothetical protein BH10ACT10_BH10ACT10_01250 [soil metagenome]